MIPLASFTQQLERRVFENDKLIDNIHAFLEQIRSMQPSAIRGQYIKTVAISATMSPGVMVAA